MIGSSAAQYYVQKKANKRFCITSLSAKINVIAWSAEYNKPWFYVYLRTKRPRFWVAADFDQSELPHRYSGHSLLHPLDQGNIFVIGTYYRPPSSNISNFLEKLECVLKIFRRKFSHLKLNICGDFNLNLLRERENIGIHKYVIL